MVFTPPPHPTCLYSSALTRPMSRRVKSATSGMVQDQKSGLTILMGEGGGQEVKRGLVDVRAESGQVGQAGLSVTGQAG